MIKKLSLIGGLMIMFLSISSLYAFKVEKGVMFTQGKNYSEGSSVYLYTKDKKEYNKNTAFIEIALLRLEEGFVFTFIPNTNEVKVKEFDFFIGDVYGDKRVFNITPYYIANEGYYFSTPFMKDDAMRLINDKGYYVYIRINKKYYCVNINKLFTGELKKASDAKKLEEEKIQKEKEYKNSPEYKQEQRKIIIERELKNYKTEKDKFENKIIIMSSKHNTDGMNARIANAHTIYIKQLL